HRVPATRRGTTGLLAAMALLGLAIAGVRMPSGESPAAVHASESLHANGETDRVAALDEADDHDSAAEANPPEKALTLTELQAFVVDQIRSIRSLHITYTKPQPVSFGGKSQDHVWAEQGFKLLKRDVPGKMLRGYAESFDGKRTYQLGYDGDQPAGITVRDE